MTEAYGQDVFLLSAQTEGQQERKGEVALATVSEPTFPYLFCYMFPLLPDL